MQKRVACPLCNAFNMAGVSACVTCNTPLPQQIEVTLTEPAQLQQPSTGTNISAQIVAEMEEERQRLEEQLRQQREGAQARERALGDENARLKQELENVPSWEVFETYREHTIRAFLGVKRMRDLPEEQKRAIWNIFDRFRRGDLDADNPEDAIREARELIRQAVQGVYFMMGYGEERSKPPDPAYEQALAEMQRIAQECDCDSAVVASDIQEFATLLAKSEAADCNRVRDAARASFTATAANMRVIET